MTPMLSPRNSAWRLLAPLLAALCYDAAARSPGQDALDLGANHYHAGEFKIAAQEFRRAVDADPALLSAWENLGWAYRRLRRPDDALNAWDIVLKIEPARPELLNERARIHAEQQNAAAARADYEKSLSFNPAQPETRLRLAELYRDSGRTAEVVTVLDPVLTDPQFRDLAVRRMLDAYEAAGKHERALALAESRKIDASADVELRKYVARIHLARGDAAYEKNDFDMAERHYQRAAQLDAKNAQIFVNLGWAQRRKPMLEEASRAWATALQLDPSLDQLYFPMGEVFEQLGDVARADEWYRKVFAKSRVNKTPAAFRLGNLALSQGRGRDAVDWFGMVIGASRGDDAWLGKIANAFVGHDHIADGVNFFSARSARDPDFKANDALAILYAAKAARSYRAGQYEASADALRLGMRYARDRPSMLRDLGLALCKSEAWDACEQAWRRFAEVKPESTEPHNLLAGLYFQRRQYAQVIRTAKRSLELKPEQPTVQLELAKALWMDNQFGESRALSGKLAAAFPDNIAIQSFWGEMLVRYRDDARARQLWTRLLKENADPEKKNHYRYKWLQATYHGGDYETGVAALKEWVREKPVPQFVFTYLAEDALFRDDKTEAVQWYEALLEHFPDNIANWLVMSQAYGDLGDTQRRKSALERARARFPDRIEIALELGDNELAAERPDAALKYYSQVWSERPTNRRAYVGMVHALLQTHRDGEARQLLARNRGQFLTEFESALLQGRVLAAAGQYGTAMQHLGKVALSGDAGAYVPILLYHGLAEGARDKSLSIANFESQMVALRREGYTAVTMTELDDILRGQSRMPSKPIVITFDDARVDSFTAADPLLKKYGMKATMFVPTALTLDNHPFYADWALMRDHAATGRWDFQSHGHRAHNRVTINSAGDVGGFLVNREWIEAQNRLETFEEYRARIEGDYRTSAQLLAANLPVTRLVAYAFPYSEAGQGDTGNEPQASDLNEKLVFDNFGYGLAQDGSGYNLIRYGDTRPRLMRRLNVPRNWDGARLLEHLAGKNPMTLAQTAKGQALRWQGKLQPARNIFEELMAQDPQYAPTGSFHLASIAYEQGRYRDSERYLKRTANQNPNSPAESLRERVLWKNRSTAGNDFSAASDSDRRTSIGDHLRLRVPLQSPVDVWLRAGALRLEERGYDSIETRELFAGLAWSASEHLRLHVEGRDRSTREGLDSRNGWFQGTWGNDSVELDVATGYDDVDTVQARLAGITKRGRGIHASVRRADQWKIRLSRFENRYDDDNVRRDARLVATYRLASLPNWRVGLEASRSDTDVVSPYYYSPQELTVTQAVLSYTARAASGWSTTLEAAGGQASDPVHGDRTSARAEGGIARQWTSRFKTNLSTSYAQLPDYQSARFDVTMDLRF